MSHFLRWMTATHTMRYHAHFRTSGAGHVYQGRFKSFAIQDDDHFLTICRYVERYACRANLVARGEDWRWGSLWRWLQLTDPAPSLLSPWPIPRRPNWIERVNEPLTDKELAAIRRCAQRGAPHGLPRKNAASKSDCSTIVNGIRVLVSQSRSNPIYFASGTRRIT